MLPDLKQRAEQFLLSGTVTVSEARTLEASPATSDLVRDCRDSRLLHLCKYPMGEMGPSSGLAELEAAGRSIRREPDVWTKGLTDSVGRHFISVARTVRKDNRSDKRWEMLTPLGAPAGDTRDAAINVFVRIISSRVSDGLIHPVLAADRVHTFEYETTDRVPGVEVMNESKRLLELWKAGSGDAREDIETDMRSLFEACSWPGLAFPSLSFWVDPQGGNLPPTP